MNAKDDPVLRAVLREKRIVGHGEDRAWRTKDCVFRLGELRWYLASICTRNLGVGFDKSSYKQTYARRPICAFTLVKALQFALCHPLRERDVRQLPRARLFGFQGRRAHRMPVTCRPRSGLPRPAQNPRRVVPGPPRATSPPAREYRSQFRQGSSRLTFTARGLEKMLLSSHTAIVRFASRSEIFRSLSEPRLHTDWKFNLPKTELSSKIAVIQGGRSFATVQQICAHVTSQVARPSYHCDAKITSWFFAQQELTSVLRGVRAK